jgi:hypothetical protein
MPPVHYETPAPRCRMHALSVGLRPFLHCLSAADLRADTLAGVHKRRLGKLLVAGDKRGCITTWRSPASS